MIKSQPQSIFSPNLDHTSALISRPKFFFKIRTKLLSTSSSTSTSATVTVSTGFGKAESHRSSFNNNSEWVSHWQDRQWSDSGLIIRRKVLEPLQDLSIRPKGLGLKRVIFQLLQRSLGCPASLGLLVRPFKSERSRSRDLLRLVLLAAGKGATMRSEARKVRSAWVTQPPIRVSFGLLLCICLTVVFPLLLITLNSSKPELLDKRIVC